MTDFEEEYVIFTFVFDVHKKEFKVPIVDADTFDGIKNKLITEIQNYLENPLDLKSDEITVILKGRQRSTVDTFEIIRNTEELLSEKYRYKSKQVISQIHLSYPKNYNPPFNIDGSVSSEEKSHLSPEKAWGYHILLKAGNTLQEVPPLKGMPTDYLRWSILCSDDNSNLVYICIKMAYSDCGGDPKNETYMKKMQEINELMKTRQIESFFNNSEKTRDKRLKRLDQVFNVKVVEIASSLREQELEKKQAGQSSVLTEQQETQATTTGTKEHNFKKMILEKLKSFYDVRLAHVEELRQKAAAEWNPNRSAKKPEVTDDKHGGYREHPKRKKRKNTRRKKRRDTRRKNTMRNKRKNTMRNKRKNTKRKTSKRE